jgi:hypothetical protein
MQSAMMLTWTGTSITFISTQSSMDWSPASAIGHSSFNRNVARGILAPDWGGDLGEITGAE